MNKILEHFASLKVILLYLLIIGISSSVSYLVYQTGNNISKVHHKLTAEQLPLLNCSSQLKHWLNEHERILYEHYATEDEKHNVPKLILAQENIALNLAKLTSAFPNDDNVRQLALLNQKSVETGSQIIEVLNQSGQARWDIVRELLSSVTRIGRNSQPLINNINSTIKSEISRSNEISNMQLLQMSTWVSIFSLSVLLVAGYIGYFIVKTIKENAEKRRMALFIEKSPNAIAAFGWDGEIQFKNVSWEQRFGSIIDRNFLEQLQERISVFIQDENKIMQWQAHNNGNDLQLNIHKIASLNQVMVFVEDISDRVRAQRSLEFLAYNDPLTGLPNFKKLEIDIEDHLSEKPITPFYMVTIGAKRLKSVSTTHGYSVSEVLMKALSIRIQSALVPVHQNFELCRLYRYTGAKFCVVVCGNKSGESVNQILGTLNECFAAAMKTPLETAYGSFFLDLQMGCIAYPEHGKNCNALVKNSNAAINEANNKKLQTILLFNNEIAKKEEYLYELETELRAADLDKQFYLVYQPKVTLLDGSMKSIEALIRWRHPEKGLISPVEFIPIAEESGLINKLGLWVLRAACKQVKLWINENSLEEIQVAVNVSPSQLLNAGFIDDLLRCLHDFELMPKHLEIEITEEVLMQDQEKCIEVLQRIREEGISIAMDDFGTGYSSLAYLHRFPLTKLKIDRSFVTDIHKNANNKSIVSAIIALSHDMGVKVIAEGVETQEELDELSALECDQAQGYFFDKPLTTDQFQATYINRS